MAGMRAEVMEFYGLTRSPRAVGYYETAHHRQLLQDIKQAAYDSDLVALCRPWQGFVRDPHTSAPCG